MSLMKTIPVGARVATQLRWEVFNVANHPIFVLPNGTLNSTAFGTISAMKIDNREMQVAARIVFEITCFKAPLGAAAEAARHWPRASTLTMDKNFFSMSAFN
jgi:hypothetical protein